MRMLTGFLKRLLGVLAALVGMVLLGYPAFVVVAGFFLGFFPLAPGARGFDHRPLVDAPRRIFGIQSPWAGWALLLGAAALGYALIALGSRAFGVREKRADLFRVVPGEPASLTGIQADQRNVSGQPHGGPKGITGPLGGADPRG